MERPQTGEYYYHFKHTPDSVENYAYKVIGTGIHSETEEIFVIYKALYKGGWTEEKEVNFTIRPLSNFTETIDRDGKIFKRFTRITDVEVIKKLQEIESM